MKALLDLVGTENGALTKYLLDLLLKHENRRKVTYDREIHQTLFYIIYRLLLVYELDQICSAWH